MLLAGKLFRCFDLPRRRFRGSVFDVERITHRLAQFARRQRHGAKESTVRSRASILRPIDWLTQVAFHLVDVHLVQKRAVVKNETPPALLRASFLQQRQPQGR